MKFSILALSAASLASAIPYFIKTNATSWNITSLEGRALPSGAPLQARTQPSGAPLQRRAQPSGAPLLPRYIQVNTTAVTNSTSHVNSASQSSLFSNSTVPTITISTQDSNGRVSYYSRLRAFRAQRLQNLVNSTVFVNTTTTMNSTTPKISFLKARSLNSTAASLSSPAPPTPSSPNFIPGLL